MTAETFLHPNRNGLWDRLLVDVLMAAGLRRVVLCPGGRNGLLALTLHRSPGMACTLHVDERSGAFLALGQSLASGEPVAVCVTSGSAVANLMPALAEADARNLPLVLLTCDRPLAGRMRREPQTLPQAELCAPFLRACLALPDPLDGSMDLEAMQKAVSGVVMAATHGNPPGPVQINIPQWGLYCATEDDPPDLPLLPAQPPVSEVPTPAAPSKADAAAVSAAVAELGGRAGLRGLIVAGPDQPLTPEAVAALARNTGYPVIADVCSGLRHLAFPYLVTTADALALSPWLDLGQTEFLIRLGEAPVSPALLRALRGLSCPTLVFAAHAPEPDFLSPRALGLYPPATAGLDALGDLLGPGDTAWAALWRDADMLAASGRARFLEEAPWGEIAAAARVCAAPGFVALHLANSLSVRYGGLLAPAGSTPQRVFSARGINGTDGVLGLILGEMLAVPGPFLALIGDQSFAHDLPALTNPLWRDQRGALCVMNNGGGGLFDLVPCSRIPGYEATMRNPPTIAYAGLAHAFGLRYRPCASVEALDAALADAAADAGMSLIEIQVAPGSGVRDLAALVRSMVLPDNPVQSAAG